MSQKKYKYSIYILFLLSFTLIFSCKTKDDTNYEVEGNIKGLNTSEIYITTSFSLDSIKVDTIPLNEGSFKYKGYTNSSAIANIFYSDSLPSIPFVVDKNYRVEIKGSTNSYENFEIKGGKINEELNAFKKANKTIFTSRSRFFEKKDYSNTGELNNLNFQLSRAVRDYVANNPDKISSVILMDQFSKGNLDPELLERDLNLLQGDASDFFLTACLRKYLEKLMATSIGKIAPNIELKSTKGNSVSLNTLRGNNVLLIFDIKETPLNNIYLDKLKQTQKKLKGRVNFLSIIIDENINNPDSATIEIAKKIDWPVLLDSQKWNSKEAIKYNITAIPYMVLISSEGMILERGISLDSLNYLFDNGELDLSN